MRIFHKQQFLRYKASWALGEGDKPKNLQDALSCTIEFCTLKFTRVREVAISVSRKLQQETLEQCQKYCRPFYEVELYQGQLNLSVRVEWCNKKKLSMPITKLLTLTTLIWNSIIHLMK